jgi:hypothetical protein
VVPEDQDWRLQAELAVADHDEALKAVMQDLAGRADGDGDDASVVTHDGATLFAYAATRAGIDAARDAVGSALAAHAVEGAFRISHWDDRIAGWLQVDPPLTTNEQAEADAVVADAEQIETRTVVARAGRLARENVEEAMQASAADLGLECSVVEHHHLLTTQLAFTVTGPRGKVDQFAAGLEAEGLAMIRADARMFDRR